MKTQETKNKIPPRGRGLKRGQELKDLVLPERMKKWIDFSVLNKCVDLKFFAEVDVNYTAEEQARLEEIKMKREGK